MANIGFFSSNEQRSSKQKCAKQKIIYYTLLSQAQCVFLAQMQIILLKTLLLYIDKFQVSVYVKAVKIFRMPNQCVFPLFSWRSQRRWRNDQFSLAVWNKPQQQFPSPCCCCPPPIVWLKDGHCTCPLLTRKSDLALRNRMGAEEVDSHDKEGNSKLSITFIKLLWFKTLWANLESAECRVYQSKYPD